MPGKGEQDIYRAPVFGESTGNDALTRPPRRSQGPLLATDPPSDACSGAWVEGIAQRRGQRRHLQHGVSYITSRSYCSTGNSSFLGDGATRVGTEAESLRTRVKQHAT